jgi:hypothetical protein
LQFLKDRIDLLPEDVSKDKESLHILMEGNPAKIDPEDVSRFIT